MAPTTFLFITVEQELKFWDKILLHMKVPKNGIQVDKRYRKNYP